MLTGVFFLFTVGMKKQCDDSMRMIVSVWKNSIFLWLLLWFSVLSLKTFVFDMNIDLILWNITEDINEGKSVLIDFLLTVKAAT